MSVPSVSYTPDVQILSSSLVLSSLLFPVSIGMHVGVCWWWLKSPHCVYCCSLCAAIVVCRYCCCCWWCLQRCCGDVLAVVVHAVVVFHLGGGRYIFCLPSYMLLEGFMVFFLLSLLFLDISERREITSYWNILFQKRDWEEFRLIAILVMIDCQKSSCHR